MKLQVQVRDNQGKDSCKKLREQGIYPAVFYGRNHQSENIQVSKREMDAFIKLHAVRSKPFKIELGKKTFSVLVKDMKRSTRYNNIEHIDFFLVEMNKLMTVNIPLRYINEDKAAGVTQGGSVDHALHEIELKTLPKNVPGHIDVDIAQLELGGSLHVSDLVLPEGCELATAVSDTFNPVMVSIQNQREEEKEAEETVAESTDDAPESS